MCNTCDTAAKRWPADWHRLLLCSAASPELRPAHSCGLPVSVQAGRGLPSGPGGEPKDQSATRQQERLNKILLFKFRFIKKNHKEVCSLLMQKREKNPEGFWPVHPVAVCGCRGAPSSAVYSPLSDYKYYLQSQTADTSTQSIHLNRKTNKLNKQHSIAKHWKTQRKQRMLQFSFVWEAPTNLCLVAKQTSDLWNSYEWMNKRLERNHFIDHINIHVSCLISLVIRLVYFMCEVIIYEVPRPIQIFPGPPIIDILYLPLLWTITVRPFYNVCFQTVWVTFLDNDFAEISFWGKKNQYLWFFSKSKLVNIRPRFKNTVVSL